MCSKDEVFKLDLWGSLQRGAHNFHLSPPDEGREMRHKEIKKLRTKRSVWCLQPPSRWINTSVRAWGQAKASDKGALQVWEPFISLCNSGFPTARGPTHLKGSMECHPCPSCWKSCELDTVCQHWPPAPQEGLWELLSWHNTRDTQQQPLCPAQQDRPRAVPCWKAELPWGWNLGNFSTRGGANTETQQPSQAHWAPLTPRGDTATSGVLARRANQAGTLSLWRYPSFSLFLLHLPSSKGSPGDWWKGDRQTAELQWDECLSSCFRSLSN